MTELVYLSRIWFQVVRATQGHAEIEVMLRYSDGTIRQLKKGVVGPGDVISVDIHAEDPDALYRLPGDTVDIDISAEWLEDLWEEESNDDTPDR